VFRKDENIGSDLGGVTDSTAALCSGLRSVSQ
jgi:hypothetical protein